MIRRLAALAALAAAAVAQAQTPWPGVALGMSPGELQAALPGAERMARPPVAPRGLRGLVTLPEAAVAGVPFQSIFYFRDQRLARIEQLHALNHAGCDARPAFNRVVADFTRRYGAGLAVQDAGEPGSVNQGASWVAGDTDVSAYLSESPARCTIRIVYKPQVLQDADTL